MLNKLTNNIGKKLHELYPTYTIYTEKIRQQFATPSFFIDIVKQKYTVGINTRRSLEVKFDIVCFMKKDTKNEIYNDIANKLNKELELIDVDGKKYRTKDVESDTTTELHYRFSMTVPLRKIVTETIIGEIENIDAGLKE